MGEEHIPEVLSFYQIEGRLGSYPNDGTLPVARHRTVQQADRVFRCWEQVPSSHSIF